MNKFLSDAEKWQKIRENPEYAPLRQFIMKEYDEFCKGRDIPVLKFSLEMEYFRNGQRRGFEKPYFLRRRQMTIYAILSLIYPENEEYFINLCDVVAAICDEYSWQVPAHRPDENRNKNDGHSLFAAETALYLAEIKSIFAGRFDPCLTARIEDAIERKILKSYESRITGVEKKEIKNNWAPVCAGSIGLAFMYEAPERFEKIKPRIEKCMENYLSGISEDGGTPEGADYWGYGYGFYALYYSTLKEVYAKKEAAGLYKDKAKKLAEFFTAILLDENNAVSFSDASADADCGVWLAYFLNREYGVPVPPEKRLGIGTNKFSATIRAFLYYDPKHKSKTLPLGERYFDKLSWYIKRGESYSFAVKGGANDIEDNHNHNDIGSFIVTHRGKQVLCDLGSPQYTAFTFGKTRYEVINNSSLGHSVPIINGEGQLVGKDVYGELSVEGKVCVDLKNAYGAKIKKLKRNFELLENELILTDDFDFGLDIVERLVADIKPQITDGFVIVADAKICVPSTWSVSVSEKDTTYHSGRERKIYLIDFAPQEKTDIFKICISFK